MVIKARFCIFHFQVLQRNRVFFFFFKAKTRMLRNRWNNQVVSVVPCTYMLRIYFEFIVIEPMQYIKGESSLLLLPTFSLPFLYLLTMVSAIFLLLSLPLSLNPNFQPSHNPLAHLWTLCLFKSHRHFLLCCLHFLAPFLTLEARRHCMDNLVSCHFYTLLYFLCLCACAAGLWL